MNKKMKIICLIIFVIIIIAVTAIVVINVNNKRREEERQNRIAQREENNEYLEAEEEIPNIVSDDSIEDNYYFYCYGGKSKSRSFIYVYKNVENSTNKYNYIYANTERLSKENADRNVTIKETGEAKDVSEIMEIAKKYKCVTAVYNDEIYLLQTVQQMIEGSEN